MKEVIKINNLIVHMESKIQMLEIQNKYNQRDSADWQEVQTRIECINSFIDELKKILE